MRYGRINPQGGVDRFADNIDPSVQTKNGFKWLPCPLVAQPSFEPTAEFVDGPTYTVNETDIAEIWTKRSLSAQEISDRKDTAVSAINGGGYSPILRALFNINNRLLALEGKQAITLAQFKAAIKALI